MYRQVIKLVHNNIYPVSQCPEPFPLKSFFKSTSNIIYALNSDSMLIPQGGQEYFDHIRFINQSDK